MLAGSKKLSRSPNLQILFSYFKPIISFTHYRHTLFSHTAFLVAKHDTIRLFSAAPNPAPKLMKLGKSKTFSVFDNHNGCIGNINTNLNHCCGHKRVYFSCRKPFHYIFLFERLHSSMQKTNALSSQNAVAQSFYIISRRFCTNRVRILHKSANKICLSPFV